MKPVGAFAASPGVLTLEAPANGAERLSAALNASTRDETLKAYDIVHDWSRLKPEKADHISATAEVDVRRLCALLGVDPSKILVSSDDTDEATKLMLLNAGKLITAYCRRLWKLVWVPRPGVEFLGIELPEHGAEPPESMFDDEPEDAL